PRKCKKWFGKRRPETATDSDDVIVGDMRQRIVAKLQQPFERLRLQVPPVSSIKLLEHHQEDKGKPRLGGFAYATKDHVAIVFRGTAYSEEWLTNISYAVPAVRNKRQLIGLVTLSLFPWLRRVRILRRLFDMEKAVQENAGYEK